MCLRPLSDYLLTLNSHYFYEEKICLSVSVVRDDNVQLCAKS